MSPVCLLCGGRGDGDGLCGGCRNSLPRLAGTRCPVCAIPDPTGELCGRCLNKPPHFDRVVAPFMYEFPVTVLIQGLKYRGNLACARPLAAGLAEALDEEPGPDLIIPMPLARARLAGRGFNQAMEISRRLATDFGLDISVDICHRLRESAPQAVLPWKQRATNVRNAFACDVDVSRKSVAVVDDVLTTGATLNELALTLKRRGAREVIGWIAARTPAPGEV
ncbi:MAG: ComF family protein [Betaproteobacteria bacterium]|nr:ComF family protein [Betaproteobacteria bacterium]